MQSEYLDNVQVNLLAHLRTARAHRAKQVSTIGGWDTYRAFKGRTPFGNALRKINRKCTPRGPVYERMDRQNMFDGLRAKSYGSAKEVFIVGNSGKPKGSRVERTDGTR